MFRVQLTGGLGNQLFQYAFGLHMSKKFNQTFKLDLNYLLDRSESKNATVFRNYQLDQFHINPEWTPNYLSFFGLQSTKSKFLHLCNQKMSTLTYHRVNERDIQTLDQLYNGHTKRNYYWGYWQSYEFAESVKTNLMDDLKFIRNLNNSSIELAKEMKSSESVCLFVRRSDYLLNNIYNVLDHSYWNLAMSYFFKTIDCPKFYVFSDDVEWCQENMKEFKNTTIVTREHDGKDYINKFQLMTNCRHFICANSSYSWWAAWLGNNKKKIVVAPKNWMNDTEYLPKYSSITPPDWILL